MGWLPRLASSASVVWSGTWLFSLWLHQRKQHLPCDFLVLRAVSWHAGSLVLVDKQLSLIFCVSCLCNCVWLLVELHLCMLPANVRHRCETAQHSTTSRQG